VDYIHYNPVKHGLVERPADWRWSSIHRYIRLGLVAADWVADVAEGGFGE
jgi:putative transposase